MIESVFPLGTLRYDWTESELDAIYNLPLTELVFQAQTVHRQYHDPNKVQQCTLLSIKTGACPEDCSYCPQSAHYSTGLDKEPLIDVDGALEAARAAQANGSTRFCMGAAWREVRDGEQFDRVLEMVRGVKALGMEACCTLGMVNEDQARRLAEAGLDAYNHNLDSGPDFYKEIISTRTYDDRLNTIQNIRKAGVTVCSGGIVGMGETVKDRIAMLAVLAGHNPHPESVPINALVAVEGTPLAEQAPVDPLVMVRMIATARIAMPGAMVRLSAGRTAMSDETQALCFLAGANSIFAGEKLLTTPNPGEDRDKALFNKLGLETLELAHS